jgi:hypothetical protein
VPVRILLETSCLQQVLFGFRIQSLAAAYSHSHHIPSIFRALPRPPPTSSPNRTGFVPVQILLETSCLQRFLFGFRIQSLVTAYSRHFSSLPDRARLLPLSYQISCKSPPGIPSLDFASNLSPFRSDLCNLSSSFSHRVPPSQDPPLVFIRVHCVPSLSEAPFSLIRVRSDVVILVHSSHRIFRRPPYTRRTQGVRTGFLWIS